MSRYSLFSLNRKESKRDQVPTTSLNSKYHQASCQIPSDAENKTDGLGRGLSKQKRQKENQSKLTAIRTTKQDCGNVLMDKESSTCKKVAMKKTRPSKRSNKKGNQQNFLVIKLGASNLTTKCTDVPQKEKEIQDRFTKGLIQNTYGESALKLLPVVSLSRLSQSEILNAIKGSGSRNMLETTNNKTHKSKYQGDKIKTDTKVSKSSASVDLVDKVVKGVTASSKKTTKKMRKVYKRNNNAPSKQKAQCPICLKFFARKCVVDIHMRTHTGALPYKCRICKQSFRQKIQLTYHMMKHKGEKQFKCQFCGKEFLHRTAWIAHEITFHQYSEILGNESLMKSIYGRIVKIIECQDCGKLFVNRSEWAIHVRSHKGIRCNVCKTCGKSFNHKSNLTEHERIHTNVKPYKCDYCGNCFRFQSNLKQHVRMHLGERNFKCKHCSKKFLAFSHLTVHERVHTGEKPYQCPYCDFCSAQNGGMKTHIRTHTGERPYQCPYCPHTAAQLNTLNIHINAHHKKKAKKKKKSKKNLNA